MKKQLLILTSLFTISAYAQVGIPPFDPATPGTFVGNFSTFTNGVDIPSTSAFDSEGDTGGANNAWTADNGTTVAAFPGGIGTWASGTCDLGQSLTLITPVMNFGTNITNPTLTFRYVIDNGSGLGAPGFFGNVNLEVMYKTSMGGSWNTLGTYSTIDDVWHNVTVDLSGASSYDTYYLGFRVYGVSPGAFYDWGYMAIDEIEVEGTDNTGCSPSSASFNSTVCGSLVSPSGSYTWTTSGTYNDTIPNVAGCDSVMTFNLTVNNVNSNATQTGFSLQADVAGAAYQWLDCNASFDEVVGATNQTFNSAQDGEYAVSVTQNGCTDTSACFTIFGLGTAELDQQHVLLYPNPTTGLVTVVLGAEYASTRLMIHSVDGKLVNEFGQFTSSLTTFELTGENGIYFVTILNGDSREVIRLVKN